MKFANTKISSAVENNSDAIFKHSFDIKHEEITSLSPFDVIWYIFHKLFSQNWKDPISRTFTAGKKGNESDNIIIGLASLINLIKIHILLKLQKNENDPIEMNDFNNDEIGDKFCDLITSIDDVTDIIDRLDRTMRLFHKIFHSFSVFKGNKKDNDSSTFLPEKTYIIVILGNIYRYIYLNKETDDNFVKNFKYSFIKYYIFWFTFRCL